MSPDTATTAEMLPTAAMAKALGISVSNLRRQRQNLFTEGEHYRVRRGLSPRGEIHWHPAATMARAEQLRSGATASTPAMPVEVTL